MRPRLDRGCAALLRALRTRDGGRQVLVSAESQPWASATFAGAHHEIMLRLEGADAAARTQRLSEGLDAFEFELGGHLVADIALDGVEPVPEGMLLSIAALTLDER